MQAGPFTRKGGRIISFEVRREKDEESPAVGQCGGSRHAAGRWGEAQGHFEKARRQSDEIPNRMERPQVLHWYGKMLVDRANPDDHERARTMLVDALDGYGALGMPVHAAMTQALLG